MFFWRHDEKFLSRAKKRAKSDRGAVFSEFALLAPIFVLLVSAMIEFAGFWDARIMANHTAWQIGRIAMVRGSKLNYIQTGVSEIDNKLAAQSMQANLFEKLGSKLKLSGSGLGLRAAIPTVCLMSTCQMGFFGGTPGSQLNDFLQSALIDPLKALFTDPQGELNPSAVIAALLESKIAETPFAFLQPVIKAVFDAICKPIIDAVLKPLLEFITVKVSGFFKEICGKLDNFLLSDRSASKRRLRQFVGAAIRYGKAKDVVTIAETKSKDDFRAPENCFYYDNRLDYPQVFAKGASSDGYKASGWTGWPPNNQVHSMYTVKVAWPYSTGWLFPVVSGFRAGEVGEVRATGYSLVLPSPNIENENLLSEGGVAFADGSFTNRFDEALKGLRDELKNYVSLAHFAYRYRLNKEEVSIFDWGGLGTTEKQLKPIVDWYGIRQSKKQGKMKYNADDAYARDSYRESWKAITGFKEKSAKVFWHTMDNCKGRIFGDDNHTSYKNRKWFCWPGGSPVRNRYYHGYSSSGYSKAVWNDVNMRPAYFNGGTGNAHVPVGLLRLRDGGYSDNTGSDQRDDKFLFLSASGEIRVPVPDRETRWIDVNGCFDPSGYKKGSKYYVTTTMGEKYELEYTFEEWREDNYNYQDMEKRYGAPVEKEFIERERYYDDYIGRHRLKYTGARYYFVRRVTRKPGRSVDVAEIERAIRLVGGANIDNYFRLFNEGQLAEFAQKDKLLLERAEKAKAATETFWDRVNRYEKEIGDMLAGNGTASMLVPEESEKLDLSDAEKVKAWARNRMAQLKREADQLYNTIDGKIPGFGAAYDSCYSRQYWQFGRNWPTDWQYNIKNDGVRRKHIVWLCRRVFEAYGLVVKANDSPPWIARTDDLQDDSTARSLLLDAIREVAKSAPDNDLLQPSVIGGLNEALSVLERYIAELDVIYQLERDYAAKLGSTTAVSDKGKKIDDISPSGKHEDVKPDHWGSSTLDPGNDDDMMGDKFKWVRGEGWRKN